jgi:hypothetical protein
MSREKAIYPPGGEYAEHLLITGAKRPSAYCVGFRRSNGVSALMLVANGQRVCFDDFAHAFTKNHNSAD